MGAQIHAPTIAVTADAAVVRAASAAATACAENWSHLAAALCADECAECNDDNELVDDAMCEKAIAAAVRSVTAAAFADTQF